MRVLLVFCEVCIFVIICMFVALIVWRVTGFYFDNSKMTQDIFTKYLLQQICAALQIEDMSITNIA